MYTSHYVSGVQSTPEKIYISNTSDSGKWTKKSKVTIKPLLMAHYMQHTIDGTLHATYNATSAHGHHTDLTDETQQCDKYFLPR
jgi:hypothetical protein